MLKPGTPSAVFFAVNCWQLSQAWRAEERKPLSPRESAKLIYLDSIPACPKILLDVVLLTSRVSCLLWIACLVAWWVVCTRWQYSRMGSRKVSAWQAVRYTMDNLRRSGGYPGISPGPLVGGGGGAGGGPELEPLLDLSAPSPFPRPQSQNERQSQSQIEVPTPLNNFQSILFSGPLIKLCFCVLFEGICILLKNQKDGPLLHFFVAISLNLLAVFATGCLYALVLVSWGWQVTRVNTISWKTTYLMFMMIALYLSQSIIQSQTAESFVAGILTQIVIIGLVLVGVYKSRKITLSRQRFLAELGNNTGIGNITTGDNITIGNENPIGGENPRDLLNSQNKASVIIGIIGIGICCFQIIFCYFIVAWLLSSPVSATCLSWLLDLPMYILLMWIAKPPTLTGHQSLGWQTVPDGTRQHIASIPVQIVDMSHTGGFGRNFTKSEYLILINYNKDGTETLRVGIPDKNYICQQTLYNSDSLEIVNNNIAENKFHICYRKMCCSKYDNND